MKAILDFLSLPLSLPINPIWDFVICLVIGEIAYRVAYSLAGDYGTTSCERGCLHWLIRIPFYFLLWLLACVIIVTENFIKAHWVWVLVSLSALALAGIIVLILIHRKKKQTENN